MLHYITIPLCKGIEAFTLAASQNCIIPSVSAGKKDLARFSVIFSSFLYSQLGEMDLGKTLLGKTWETELEPILLLFFVEE